MRPIPLLALALSAVLAAGPVLAEKPDHAGGPKHKDKSEKHGGGKHGGGKEAKKAEHPGGNHGPREVRVGSYFNAGDRDHVHRYYASSGGGKGCPRPSSSFKCSAARRASGCGGPGANGLGNRTGSASRPGCGSKYVTSAVIAPPP